MSSDNDQVEASDGKRVILVFAVLFLIVAALIVGSGQLPWLKITGTDAPSATSTEAPAKPSTAP